MNYNLIFIDADNTLLDDRHTVPPENIAAIRRASEAGVGVVICSGRSSVNILGFIGELGLDPDKGYFIAFNGCLICGTNGGIIRRAALDKRTALGILGIIKESGLTAIAYHDPTYTVTEAETPYAALYYEATRLPHKVVGSFADALADETPKVLALGGRPDLERLAAKASALSSGGFNVFFSAENLLEFTAPGATKGAAMLYLAEILGIPRCRTAAIGDNQNDISMIESAGLGVAVANALGEVKAAAKVVTARDNNHGAVAEFIDNYVL
ncbi:MAG: Cof-type HAD-IIB family hydrolase [Clostridiales bacterium]|jgi:Cof subfamily protein (haloacid dehalogenase superfamily)|nr:Cof-type HAD-IIB family hydrolase [Clostridiales bacterium]